MPSPTGLSTDFDFLHGEWDVVHRRLRTRGVGSDDWDVFPSTSTCEPRLGGIANVEEIRCPDRGFSGMTLRVFDPEARRWSIWWVSSNRGRLEPPVIGGFDGAVGIFEGDDTDDGAPVRVRFVWTVLAADRARWEQAFAREGGEWETNWVMEFTRR